MERVELCGNVRVFVVHARSGVAGRCRRPREGRREYDENQTLTEEGATAAKKLFHVLVMTVRGPALAVIRGLTDMNGALTWRALITRYAPNTAP